MCIHLFSLLLNHLLIYYYYLVKKLRSHRIYTFALSFLLSLALMIPAQEMMLLCDMMSNDHESISSVMNEMDHHEQSADCDSTGMGEGEESENTLCNTLVDCNCMVLVSARKDAVVSAPTPIIVSLSSTFESLNTSATLSEMKEIFPPPIWSLASYSPPNLFLENESFLI